MMGDREIIGLVGIGIMFFLLVVRVPVGLAMISVGILGNYALSLSVSFLKFEPFIRQFKSLLWGVVANYELTVIPLFILMGNLASRSGLSRDLFQGFHVLVWRIRGGVAIATIAACAGFGSVCGSSIATASTMGKIALPELRRLNYAHRLSTGCLAAGGTLGILIPPSLALVIYAILVEGSIIDMFRAAIIPGVLAVFFFILVIAIQVRIKPDMAPRSEPLPPEQVRQSLVNFIPVMAIFLAIILGLGFGLFSPTPAAAIGATVVLVFGLLRKRLGAVGVKQSILDTAVTSGMIYFVLFGAEVLKIFLSRAGLPASLAAWTAQTVIDPWFIMICMLAVLIGLGFFMDSLSIVLVVLPFFWPTLVDMNGGDSVLAIESVFGMDTDSLKIWFGIVILVVIELGLITPPVGLNVFVISSLAKDISMTEVFLGVMPFFAIEIIRISLLLLFPALSLFIPLLLRG